MEFLTAKWIWMYIAALLIVAEIVIPSFVVIFFGFAAATAGIFMWLFPGMPFWAQLLVFTVSSIVYLVTIRPLLVGRKVKTVRVEDIEDGYTGKIVTVTAKIEPGINGRVILGDAEWDAASTENCEVGERVKIVSRDNLTFAVAK